MTEGEVEPFGREGGGGHEGRMEGREGSHGEKGRRRGVGWKANGCGMEGRTENKLKLKKKPRKMRKECEWKWFMI